MKNIAFMKTVVDVANGIGFKTKKYSPEILMIGGIVGVVTSAVMACKATTKAESILEECREQVKTIHEVSNDPNMSSKYTNDDRKKDLTFVYTQTAFKFVKLYTPSVALGVLSITSILASNNILRKRNVALSAAYATIDKSFREYRNRVIEKFGKDIDREMKYGIKAKKIEKTVVDEETGKEKKVKENAFVVNPSDISGYARFFEKYTKDDSGNTIVNSNWQNNNEYNLLFIKSQERFANDLLKSRKRLFLNDVYEMLGLPRSKAGQIVGWVYDPENPNVDSYVDFGLYSDNLSYSDYVNGYDNAILLDFNVDGNIWDLMT